jgi:integrase
MPKRKHEWYNLGVIRHIRPDRWQAEWNRDNPKGRKRGAKKVIKRRHFDRPEKARAWIDQKYAQYSGAVAPLSLSDSFDANQARKILLPQVSLTEAARFYMNNSGIRIKPATVKETIQLYLDEKKGAGHRQRSLQESRSKMAALAKLAGSTLIDAVSTETIADWLATKNAGWTRDGYRRAFHAYFEWAKGRSYCTKNPVEGIRPSIVDESAPKVWTVAEAKKILTATKAKHPELVPYIAIGMFAGLRSTELYGLLWTDIGANITVRSAVAKKRRSRIIPISANLRAILKPRLRQEGPVRPYAETLLKAARKAIVEASGAAWPDNAMRHSFISYRMALVKSAAAVALEAGNSPDVVFEHYRELVTEKDAKAYFNLGV